MEHRNYLSMYDIEDKNEVEKEYLKEYQENIVYLSKKDEGASFFLKKLAKNICSKKKIPVIYLKIER